MSRWPWQVAVGSAAAVSCFVLWLKRQRPLAGRLVRLLYLDAKSLGEPIRLALHVAGVEFEVCSREGTHAMP